MEARAYLKAQVMRSPCRISKPASCKEMLKKEKIKSKECTLTILTIQPAIWSEFGPLEVESQSLENDARKCCSRCAVMMVLHAGITTDKIKSTNDAVKRNPGVLDARVLFLFFLRFSLVFFGDPCLIGEHAPARCPIRSRTLPKRRA